jgi:hypothetical protein
MVASPKGLGHENESAGKDQQQLKMTDPSASQRGYYLRTMTAGVQLRKKSGLESKKARRQDELIGGKPPVVK